MKNYLQKFLFGLLVLVFSLCMPLRLSAAELSVTNDPLLEEYTELARSEFSQIYTAVWCSDRFDEKVEEAVRKSVASHTEKLLWGTRKIQLCLNMNGVLDSIREKALADFLPEYEKFLAEVQKKFSTARRSIPKGAYGAMVTALMKESDLVSQIFLRIFTEPMLADDGKAISKKIAEALPGALGERIDAAAINEKAPQMEAWGFGRYLTHIFNDIPTWIASDFSMDLNEYFAHEGLTSCWKIIDEDVRKGLSVVLFERETLLGELNKFVAEPKVRELQQEIQQADKKEFKTLRAKAEELVKDYLVVQH